MSKSRFGGDKYKPHQLGPEPSAPSEAATVARTAAAPPKTAKVGSHVAPPASDALRDVKVQFSSRISYSADQQLKSLAKQGHTQTDLLAEALNLLFKKHGLDEVA